MAIQFLSNVKRGERCSVSISDEDSDLLQHNWTVSINGGKYPFNNKLGTLHVVIMERILGRPMVKGEEVDHRDRDRLNATRDNLRLSSRSFNGANRAMQSNNTYGYKGVRWNNRMKVWDATIKVNGNNIYLGNFGSMENCAIAWNHAAHEHFREFAVFNDIPGWEDIHPLKIPDMPRWNKRNKSGYRGVCWHKRQEKWTVMITKDNVNYNLGSFDDKHEAARVYNAKALELYGANAYQNEVE